jgi:hypothetical protein
MLFVNDAWHITIVCLFLDHRGPVPAIKVEHATFLFVTSRNIRGFWWRLMLCSGLYAIDIIASVLEYSLVLFYLGGFQTWRGFWTVDRNKNLILFMLFSIKQLLSIAWSWTIVSSFPHTKFTWVISNLRFNIFVSLYQPLSNQIVCSCLYLIRTFLGLRLLLLIRQIYFQLLYWVNPICDTKPARINLR